jgi:hypothetical protein
MTELLTPAAPTAGAEAVLDVYRRHTPLTDPGRHAAAFADLPDEVGDLVEVIGGVFAHYEFDLGGTGFEPGPARLTDVDLRTVPAILDRIHALDPRPLGRPRPVERKVLGVCRDASLLLCSVLRTRGVPARLRYGVAHHLFFPGRPMHDHVVVEYWDAAERRWKYADGRMYASVRAQHHLPDRFRDDIPTDMFLTGGQAWLRAQDSERAAFRLSGYLMDADAGRWQARNMFLYDLASLFGWEPLMWDAWGYIRRSRPRARPRGPVQFWKLNRLAALDPLDPAQWHRLRRGYRRMRLVRLPASVLSCSPVNGRRTVPAPAAWRSLRAGH